MQAVIVVKSVSNRAMAVAEALFALKNVDRVMLLDSNDVMLWVSFEDMDSLTSLLKRIRGTDGVNSTETKFVLSKLRIEIP